ncbi:uncharacterized protein LOC131234455 [Magnolia sinica]|uniref:uncharacterized protein LOC131234455 n=1 Tax=Magnolia sinica TaxID=86752 RepID=UPI002659FF36|nr:uncharacterized protein LOC131234455 [Magnolia sinica]
MQDSGVEDQERVDQRKNSSMEDSTMTIEFLRARLLSERSVSRTARQRADQLAKKVVELEEQIKIVSIQRKKAEKALAEVLAVLDSHGISELSEGFDSNSDQEGDLCESKESNSSVKEEELSMTSKSGSELEVSSNQGGSLSWKSGSNTPNPLEKKKFGLVRRRNNSVVSTGGSSSNHRSGKSCRRIKRKETRLTGEDGKDATLLIDAQDNGVATGPEYLSNHSEDRPEIANGGFTNEEDKVLSETRVSSSLDDQRKENGAGLHSNGSDRDAEMERALEQQAQLIGRFEAQENAQREWEEKFRENNGHTLDCEPGNLSDMIEERNEPKTEAAEPVDTTPSSNAAELGLPIPSNEQGPKQNADEIRGSEEPTTRTLYNAFVPTDPTTHVRASSRVDEFLPGQQHGRMQINGYGSGFQDPTFTKQEQAGAMMKGNQNLEWSRNNPEVSLPSDLKFRSLSYGSSQSQPAWMSSSFQGDGSFSKGDWSCSQNQLVEVPHLTSSSPGGVVNAFHRDENFSRGEVLGSQNQLVGVAHQTSNSWGGVLEALQLAKLSLQNELERVPSPIQGMKTTVPDTRIQAIKAIDAVDIPIGSSGLFRLPIESVSNASYQADFSRTYPDYGSSSTKHGSDSGFGIASADRYPTNLYMESGSRISSGEPYYDPYLDSVMGTPAASRSPYPYKDLMARLPSGDGFPGPYSHTRTGIPFRSQYSLNDDQFRSNMHRP